MTKNRLRDMAEGYDALDMKCQMIIDDYDRRLESYENLREVVMTSINNAIRKHDVEVTAVEGRVKKRDSLIGKLVRKGNKYVSLNDITDILGVRIITLYSDDVEDLISSNEEDAYKFAMSQLADTDIDIIASTVALQNLLIVSTLKNGGGKKGLEHIYDELNGKSIHNEALAEIAYMQASNLPFMNK